MAAIAVSSSSTLCAATTRKRKKKRRKDRTGDKAPKSILKQSGVRVADLRVTRFSERLEAIDEASGELRHEAVNFDGRPRSTEAESKPPAARIPLETQQISMVIALRNAKELAIGVRRLQPLSEPGWPILWLNGEAVIGLPHDDPNLDHIDLWPEPEMLLKCSREEGFDEVGGQWENYIHLGDVPRNAPTLMST